MKSLTQDQLAYIRSYERSKSPRTIARDLKLDVKLVQDALARIRAPEPERPVVAALAAPTYASRGELPGWIRWATIAVIVVASLIAYSNNLACGWHFDDSHSITGNPAIQHPTFVGIYQNNVYRQVLYWTFALSWKLHGADVRGWHIENNLIHILNALLVYALTMLTLRSPGARGAVRWRELVAGFAALIFALHPLQTQAVTYITQRTESLAATFYLAALILYALARLRRAEGRTRGEDLAGFPIAGGVMLVLFGAGFVVWRPGDLLPVFLAILGLAAAGTLGVLGWLVKEKRLDLVETALLAGALVATFFGCETKEIAGTIPVAVILWELLFARPRGTKLFEGKPRDVALRYASAAPWAGMLLVLPFLAVRAGLAVHFLAGENNEEHAAGFSISGPEYFFTQLNVLVTYLRLFLLPYGQTLDYDYPKASSLFSMPTLVSLVAIGGLVALAVKSWRRRPLLSWSILFAFAVLLPTSSVFVLPDFIYEHRVYLPIAGAALVAAILLERVVGRLVADPALAQKVFVGVAVPVLAVCLVLTRARNEVWASEETLWSDCIAKAPQKPRPKTNLGLYYQNIEPWKIVLRDGSVYAGEVIDGDTRNGFAGKWLVRPTLDEQHRIFQVNKNEIVQGPVEWGGTARAEKLYDQAIAIDKYYYKARNNYALCEIQNGGVQLEKAVELRQQEKQLRERQAPQAAIEQLESRAQDCSAEATAHFEKAAENLKIILESRPRDYVAMSNLANLYFSYLDQLDEAIGWMEKSVAIDSRQPIVLAVLGEMLYTKACEVSSKGDHAGAIPFIRRAIDAYQRYLEHPGDDGNVPHIRYRLQLCEKGLKEGGLLSEVEQGDQVATFQGRAGANPMRGSRFKPTHLPAKPQGPGN